MSNSVNYFFLNNYQSDNQVSYINVKLCQAFLFQIIIEIIEFSIYMEC